MSEPYPAEAVWVKRVWPAIGGFVISTAIVGSTLAFQPGYIPRMIAAVMFESSNAVAGAATWHTARHMVSFPVTWKGRFVFYAAAAFIAALGINAAWAFCR